MASIENVLDFKVTSWKDARDILRDLRETGARDSRKIAFLGKLLVTKYSSKLGDEVWTVHEQLISSALDTGDFDTAESSYRAVQRMFPGSERVKRLEGLILEAKKQYDEALSLYDEMLEKEPTNLTIAKRRVAVHKAKGDKVAAITELTKILEMYMTDNESWAELADLYISEHSYEKAAFCLEELILANPHNYLNHQRYAEVCYSQGTLESLLTARKHFATAIKLNPGSTRSLYGLHHTSLHIAHNPKQKAKREDKVKSDDVLTWTSLRLQQIYQDNPRCLKIVEQYVKIGK